MANDNVNPYNVNAIVETLNQSRQGVKEAMDTQSQQMAQIQNQIQVDMEKSRSAIEQFRVDVEGAMQATPDAPATVSLERQAIDINSIVAPMKEAVEQQVTNMRNSYNSQIQVQAKQLDAAVGAGAFGGNSLRAQQSYQSSMNQLFNESNAQIASLVLSAEQTIMGTVSELSSLQTQLDQAAVTEEARLNVEQSIRYREMINTREVQLLGLMGNLAQMTVEAGSVMTGNWLNLFNINNNSMNQLIRVMADIDITEAGVRQQLARDVFGAEMQAIQNNMRLQEAYIQANTQRYVAQTQASVATRVNRTQQYVAELNAETNIRMAELQGEQQMEITALENQAAADIIQSFSSPEGAQSTSQNIQNLISNQGFTRIS